MLLPTLATRAFGHAVRDASDNATSKRGFCPRGQGSQQAKSGKGTQPDKAIAPKSFERKELGSVSSRIRLEEVPPWRGGASARGDDRITWGRSARPSHTRVPGSEYGRKARRIGLLANALLNKSKAVACPKQGRLTSRARGNTRGSVLASRQEGALGAVIMAWRNVRRQMWPTLRKAIFKLTVFKITRVLCGLPCKMQWWATCSNIAVGS